MLWISSPGQKLLIFSTGMKMLVEDAGKDVTHSGYLAAQKGNFSRVSRGLSGHLRPYEVSGAYLSHAAWHCLEYVEQAEAAPRKGFVSFLLIVDCRSKAAPRPRVRKVLQEKPSSIAHTTSSATS